MFRHVINNLLYSHIHIVFYDSLIYVSNHTLNYSELLEKFSAGIQDFLRENVLLSINPEVGEPLLCGIKDLREVAEGAFLVEYFVSFRKLFSIVSWGAACFVNLAQAFHLVQEPLASSLAILRVKVVFLVGPLFEVVAHHHSVF